MTNVERQYEDYDSSPIAPVSAAAKASEPPIVPSSSPPSEHAVTGAPSAEPVVQDFGLPIIDMGRVGLDEAHVVHSEERIEYRDQDGNLLDEEQVKALEGKVEFHTRYETRTRLLDTDGNELHPSEVPESVAGPLVDGSNPETVKAEKQVGEDELKVREMVDTESREVVSESAASPASEGIVSESAASEEVISESAVVQEATAEEAVVQEAVVPEAPVEGAVAKEAAAEKIIEEVVAEVISESAVTPKVHTETKWQEAVHTETVVVDEEGNTLVE